MRAPYSMSRDANPGCVRSNLALTIGGTGAVSSFRGMMLKDTTAPPIRNSAGNYTITYDRAWNGLVGFSGAMLQQSGEALEVVLVTDNSTTTGTLIIETRASNGTATDPTSGDKIFIECVFDEAGLNF